MKTSMVSILMPVYNTSSYLVDCLESICSQTYTNWELIAVDDFSTDNSADILNQYAERDRRIKVLTNHQKGIIPALEQAYRFSVGKWITRMDSDDKMPADKLERMVKAMDDNDKCLVTGKVRYFSSQPVSEGYLRYEKWLNQLVDEQDHWLWLYRECVIASPNWMVHSNCFTAYFPFSALSYPEDYDMVFHWYAHGFYIKSVDAVTHLWREHETRTSRTVEAYQQKAFFQLKTKHFLQLHGKGKEVQLVGTGQKGKYVAIELEKQGVSFTWHDLKPGGVKRGRRITTLAALQPNRSTIITAWPFEEKIQDQIREFLLEKGIVFGENGWLF